MKVCCVLSLESPHRGNSNEYTIYHFQYKKISSPKFYQIGSVELVPSDSKSSSKQHGKRAISVRVTEVLLYIFFNSEENKP